MILSMKKSSSMMMAMIVAIIMMTISVVQAFTTPANSIINNKQRNNDATTIPVFQNKNKKQERISSVLQSTTNDDLYQNPDKPQIWSSGQSSRIDLLEAIQEATEMAIEGLPFGTEKVDFATISISSLYDTSPTLVVPTMLSSAKGKQVEIQELIGSTVSGYVSSIRNEEFGTLQQKQQQQDGDETDDDKTITTSACTGIESEGVPGVSIVLSVLPDVQIRTFHVDTDDVPDDVGRIPSELWKDAVGLRDFDPEGKEPVLILNSSPSFQTQLDDFLLGVQTHLSSDTKIVGGIASTVSSLSRPRLFRYSSSSSSREDNTVLADGCVGVAMVGDITCETHIAQGTKPVGGIYRIVAGQDSTISAIVLDETATQEVMDSMEDEDEDDEEEEEDDDEKKTKSQQMAAAYAKAIIPKPVLAEANFIMRTLSDDDQAAMRKAILIGLEQQGGSGSMPSTPNELLRLAKGEGYRWRVFQVASAAMKDGSVTLPLKEVTNIRPGTRVRFFVRDATFGRKELQALWTGYKKNKLERTLRMNLGMQMNEKEGSNNDSVITANDPTMAFVWSSSDRGDRFFGTPSYESQTLTEYVPTLPTVSGFFANGVIGKQSTTTGGGDGETVRVHGSATTYAFLSSKSPRPLYYPSSSSNKSQEEETIESTTTDTSSSPSTDIPRDENGELVLKRREVHSGRALTVSTVEWSVAEKTAVPTSTLEGFMWDKETEVDRFRERVPLANLVSQCRALASSNTGYTTRPYVESILSESKENNFVIIPECKRTELNRNGGSLYKRYNVDKIVTKMITTYQAAAISINSDAVLFGGSLEDVKSARDASDETPILASDLILYPYQLYKLQMAGADAINLIGGALASKDLLYLSKIASSLKLQVLVTVTTEYQLKTLRTILKNGAIHGIIVSNRKLSDFSFDESGQQALNLLQSEELQSCREHFGNNIAILVEGRIGLIQNDNDYIQQLQDAGAMGAIVGSGLAKVISTTTTTEEDDTLLSILKKQQQEEQSSTTKITTTGSFE